MQRFTMAVATAVVVLALAGCEVAQEPASPARPAVPRTVTVHQSDTPPYDLEGDDQLNVDMDKDDAEVAIEDCDEMGGELVDGTCMGVDF